MFDLTHVEGRATTGSDSKTVDQQPKRSSDHVYMSCCCCCISVVVVFYCKDV